MWNFIHINASDRDIELLFEPLTPEDEIVRFSEPFNLSDCVVKMGVFPSKTQAKKNGWIGEIPQGFKEHKIGKKLFWTYIPMHD